MTAGQDADLAFERQLLDSARGDVVSEVHRAQAWESLVRSMDAASLGAGVGAGTGLLRRFWNGSPSRWALLGALGGAAATALVLGGSASESERSPKRSLPGPILAPRASAVELAAPAPVASEERTERSVALPPIRSERRTPMAASGPARSSSSSGLEREVRALDAARTALEARAPARALQLLDDYAAAFPDGQLGLDAEVVAIRALEVQGLWSQADQRANAYMAAHPDDPHVATLRARGAGR